MGHATHSGVRFGCGEVKSHGIMTKALRSLFNVKRNRGWLRPAPPKPMGRRCAWHPRLTFGAGRPLIPGWGEILGGLRAKLPCGSGWCGVTGSESPGSWLRPRWSGASWNPRRAACGPARFLRRPGPKSPPAARRRCRPTRSGVEAALGGPLTGGSLGHWEDQLTRVMPAARLPRLPQSRLPRAARAGRWAGASAGRGRLPRK
jgi:hypothetical protein